MSGTVSVSPSGTVSPSGLNNNNHSMNDSRSTSISLVSQPRKSSSQFIGLRNIGNSCYMNSIIQALLNLDLFMEDLKSPFWSSMVNLSVKNVQALASETTSEADTRLSPDANGATNMICSKEICKVSTLLWQKDRAMIDLSRLKSAVASQQGGSAFVGYGQQDAHEFLCSLISMVETECVEKLTKLNSVMQNETFQLPTCVSDTGKKAFEMLSSYLSNSREEKNPRWIDDLTPVRRFRSCIDVSLECCSCSHLRIAQEYYKVISLNLVSDVTSDREQVVGEGNTSTIHYPLSKMFNSFFAEEFRTLDCEHCVKEESDLGIPQETMNHSKGLVKVTSKFSALPDILVIHLNRFEYNIKFNQLQKLHHHIHFKSVLDLEEYCTVPVPEKHSENNEQGKVNVKDEIKNDDNDDDNNAESADKTSMCESDRHQLLSLSLQDLFAVSKKGEHGLPVTGQDNGLVGGGESVVAMDVDRDLVVESLDKKRTREVTDDNFNEVPVKLNRTDPTSDYDVVCDDNDTRWPCGACTYLNIKSHLACTVCARERCSVDNMTSDTALGSQEVDKIYPMEISNCSLKKEIGTSDVEDSSQLVDAPVDISPLDQNEDTDTSCEYKYALCCVVRHIGNTEKSGHYTCDIKKSALLTGQPSSLNWLHCDDSRVAEISEETVLNETHTPYMLFYKRMQ